MKQMTACLLALIGVQILGHSQAKMTNTAAYNLINTGTKNGATVSSVSGISNTSMSNEYGSINLKPDYSNKVKIGYAIPIEIVFEYILLKVRLNAEIANDPDNYWACSPDVQQALSNLAYGEFVKISEYNKVNVKLNFRFSPPKMVNYGSVTDDYVNNSHSSPYDPGVYKMPSTPVAGTKTLIIKK